MHDYAPLPLSSIRTRRGVSMKIEGNLQLATEPKMGHIATWKCIDLNSELHEIMLYTHKFVLCASVSVWWKTDKESEENSSWVRTL